MEYLLLKFLEKENIPKEQVQRVYLSPNDAASTLYQGTCGSEGAECGFKTAQVMQFIPN